MNIQFRFGDDLESIKELSPRIYSPVLPVVSNFGDGDSEAGETYTHARNYEEMQGGGGENDQTKKAVEIEPTGF